MNILERREKERLWRQKNRSWINKNQKRLRAENDNLYTHKYEKTKKGFLMRLYRNMESRVSGIQKIKYHLYQGKELLDRQEFYDWAQNSKKFHELFDAWTIHGYDKKLTPSVDRIDPRRGYCISNMEWVTHSENSRRGSLSQSRIKYSPNYQETDRS